MYTNKEYKFGDLMELLSSVPNLVLFVGIDDFVSLNALKETKEYFSDKNIEVLYLNYNRNKSLMLDLNVRVVPVLIIFKNMNVDEYITLPNIKDKLEKYYESLKTSSRG